MSTAPPRTCGPRAGPPLLAALVAACLTAVAGCAGAGPVPVTGLGPDQEALIGRVRTLAAPALAGRGAGTAEALAAADTIARWFAAAGLRPAGAAGWFQDVPLDSAGARIDRNVVGLLPGTGPLAGRYVVVGAHHDHLGRVSGVTAGIPAPGEYHPGADDNASGVSVLVELARLAALQPGSGGDTGAGAGAGRRGVVFAAFAAEETGLRGSRAFLAAPPVPADSLDAMLNLDSVGRLREGVLHVAGVGTSPAFGELLAAVPAAGLSLRTSEGGHDAGDHVAFDQAGVPALFLFTGAHEDYHRPGDEWTRVEPAGLARVARFAADLLGGMRAHPGDFPHVRLAGPPPAAAGGRRAWLGAIPDFTERARGIGVGGAMPGSPAAAAGLREGDVLLELAGRELRDLAHLAEVLRELAPGQTVEVSVLRGGEVLRLPVTLAERQGK